MNALSSARPTSLGIGLGERPRVGDRRIVIAAGGTGGHFFPAEALAAELVARGHPIALLTDARSGALGSAVFQGQQTHVIKGAGIAGRGLVRGATAVLALAAGTLAARRLIERLRPAIIVGFGGYPTVAPVLAARMVRRRPAILLHEQNAVLGRANRLLARFADHLALGLDHTRRLPGIAHTVTGNPVRPGIQALAGAPYTPPAVDGPIHLLVTGGSLGARIFSDAVPAAIGLLSTGLRARLHVVQQCRAEDIGRVRAAYAGLGVPAELSVFFPDMPARIAQAHLVVARAGASTVAEIAAIGRPAILVPLPGAIDNHQAANAASVDATVLDQAEFAARPAVLAEALCHALSSPDLLDMQAHAVAVHGRPHAAAVLADLVEHLMQREHP
jgi:UDP-N-acetylglucosamine--N-acetylmuramyl-(pentapeptide) pyrophosphoryl-undecaprenol N-acetylglucosamine transferase